MKVTEALTSRKSTRAFLDKEVSKELINQILQVAKTAPSGTNTQPWQVAVVSGNTKNKLCSAMENAFLNKQKAKMDYQYYPKEFVNQYKARRKECGLLMYSTLKITREDKQLQLQQWAANYRAFDAPVMLLFFIDDILEKGSYLDYGMFIQSVMLAATELGLATCPQAALAEYPEITREILGFNSEKLLLCGLALGYEDKTAAINSYRTSRIELSEFVSYFD